MTKSRALEILRHAEWYCRYGSSTIDREATKDDLLAADLLHRLWNEVAK